MDVVFNCTVCKTSLSAPESQSGSLVRCPTCLTTLRVPTLAAAPAAAPAFAGASTGPMMTNSGVPIRQSVFEPPTRSTIGRRYGFNCGYCSSRLEANESMAAQEGSCPTCGNTITIPILDRYGRLIDPKTRQIIKQDPHPVHAYAAAGDRAPKIIRQRDGGQTIQCTRCGAFSGISANNCKSCGMPFTMEGTTLEAAGTNNGFCVAALVLGIIGIPAFCSVITPVLAIVFGIIGYTQASKEGAQTSGKGMAIAGIILGAIGTLMAASKLL
jgi:DNA-directed RNA polymerase subunit RPC12/RpoP